MSPKQYAEFMARKAMTERAHACKHGHYDCSDRDGGPCCDEEMPRDENGDEIEYMPDLTDLGG